MKKVSKKQKIILIIGVISIVIFGFRPILEQIEMRKVNLNDQSSSRGSIYVQALTDIEITGQKTYANYDENYRVAKGDIVSLYFINDRFCRSTNERQCFSKDQFRILSTKDDKALLNNYLNVDKNISRLVKFIDLNKDNIDDLLISDGKNNYNWYINFYSAHENQVLWQITESIKDDFYGPLLHVVITDITRGPATIIIYQPEDRKEYSFYKSLNQKGYKIVKPNREDWRNYWQNISTFELSTRVFGFWGLLLLIFLLLTLSTLFFIIILVLIVKFCIFKIVSKVKLKNK